MQTCYLTLLQNNSTFSQDYPCMLDISGIHDKQCIETLISFQCLSFFFLRFDKLSLLSWFQPCVDNNSIYIEMIDSPIIGDKNVDKVNSLTCYLFNFISIDLVKSTYLPPPPPLNNEWVVGMEGLVNDLECGRNKSIILLINSTVPILCVN